MKKIGYYIVGVLTVALLMSVVLVAISIAIPHVPVSMTLFLPLLTAFGVCIPVLIMDIE